MTPHGAFRSGFERGGGKYFAAFFGLFWSAITCVFLGVWGYGLVRQLNTLSYGTAQGQITHSRIASHRDEDGETYGLDVAYRYVVCDTQYTGTRYRYREMSSNSRWAHRWVDAYPAGTAVTVHYNPRDPADACCCAGSTAPTCSCPCS